MKFTRSVRVGVFCVAVALTAGYFATLPASHFNRGNTLYELNRYEEALAAYDKAIEINPNSEKAHNNRKNLLASMSDSDLPSVSAGGPP